MGEQVNYLTLRAECTLLVAKAYSGQNGTRQHYATLPGSMASYVHGPVQLKISLTYLFTLAN